MESAAIDMEIEDRSRLSLWPPDVMFVLENIRLPLQKDCFTQKESSGKNLPPEECSGNFWGLGTVHYLYLRGAPKRN